MIRTLFAIALGGLIALGIGHFDPGESDNMPPGGQYAPIAQPAPTSTPFPPTTIPLTSTTTTTIRPPASSAIGIPIPVSDIVYCPTEDSCDIDYRNGTWWITPTIP